MNFVSISAMVLELFWKTRRGHAPPAGRGLKMVYKSAFAMVHPSLTKKKKIEQLLETMHSLNAPRKNYWAVVSH